MDKELLEQLIEFVKSASETMWAAAHQMVIADIVTSAMWAVVLLGFAGAAAYLFRYSLQKYHAVRAMYCDQRDTCSAWDSESWGSMAAMAFVSGFFMLIVGLVALSDAIGCMVARDYYAIKNLVELIP